MFAKLRTMIHLQLMEYVHFVVLFLQNAITAIIILFALNVTLTSSFLLQGGKPNVKFAMKSVKLVQ